MTERRVLHPEVINDSPRPREKFYVADESIEIPVNFDQVIENARTDRPKVSRAHTHDHGHSHMPTGTAPATYEPGRKLNPKERRTKFLEGLGWSALATVAMVADAIVHFTPGTGDDVVFHGLAAILLGAAGRGFNSFWRGHDMPGSEINVSKVMSEFWACWRRNGIRNVFKFMTEAAEILHEHVPQPVEREKYKGEGNPISSVTYARENIRYNRYAETDGPLRGWRKRAFSRGVLVATAISYTVGSALREAIITNLHESAEWTEQTFKLKRGSAAHWLTTAGIALLVAPVRAVYGVLDGGYRYENEFKAGKNDGHNVRARTEPSPAS